MSDEPFGVVGCTNCEWFWIIDEDGSKSRNCPRCNTTHQDKLLKRIEQTDDQDFAEAARAVVLAKTSRRDHGARSVTLEDVDVR